MAIMTNKSKWEVKDEMSTVYISHSGVLNMKWGQRKYQNPDGTWTEEGKARRRAMYEKAKSSKKPSPVIKVIKGPKQESTKPAQQKPAQSKNDDYLKDQIEEERRKSEELRRQRQDALETARYRAELARLNEQTITSQMKVAQLTAPKEKESAFNKYFAPALAQGMQNGLSNALQNVGNAYVKKITGPTKKEPQVTTTYDYDGEGNLRSMRKTVTTGNSGNKKGDKND